MCWRKEIWDLDLTVSGYRSLARRRELRFCVAGRLRKIQAIRAEACAVVVVLFLLVVFNTSVLRVCRG